MNLLLEGSDLSELLLRAARTGGAQTRIVRAEKVRRGGVLGFFAREAFEVAIEIPAQSDDPPVAEVQVTAAEPAQPVILPWTLPQLPLDGAVVHDHDHQSVRDHAGLHRAQAADHDDVPFVPSQLVPTSLLELAERVSATEQAGARSLAAQARYQGAQPHSADMPVQPSWPVFGNPSPAPTVNRLNESGLSADLAGVSEPFEQTLPSGRPGRDGLDEPAAPLDDSLGDGLGAVFLDAQERGNAATSLTADASGYDASLGYGTDGDFAAETEFSVESEFAIDGDFGAIDDFGPTGVFGAVDDAADYGGSAGYGDIGFEGDPAYSDEPLHDLPTPGLLDPISHDLPTPGLVPGFQEPGSHDAVPGLVPPLEQPIAHVVTTPGLVPSLDGPPEHDVAQTVPGLEPPLTQYADETAIVHEATAAVPELAPALEVPEPRRLSTYEEIDALSLSHTTGEDVASPAENHPDHEPAADSIAADTFSQTPGDQIAPNPARPQFTAMIHQLREGFRLGKHRLDGPRHTPDHPVVAETTGLPGNSASFVSPGEDGGSPIEGAAWSSVVNPDGHPAIATLEAERTMTTLTEPITDSYDEQAGTAGTAPEGPDTVDSDGINTDGGHDAQAPGGGEMPVGTLADVRAMTIVPSGKSRSRRRKGGVPVPRPSVEDEPIEFVEETAPAAVVVATIEPDEASELTADPDSDPDSVLLEDSYAGPEGYADADAELLGQPELDEPVREASSGGAAWRMLRALRPRRRRNRDDEDLWVPEIADGDNHDADGDEHWTHSDEYAVEFHDGAADHDHGQPGAVPVAQWAPEAVHRLEPPSFDEAGIFGQPTGSDRTGQLTGSGLAGTALRASAAGVHPADSQDQLAMDREALRALGVPAAWTRHLQPGDRFTSIVAMLERLPQLEIPEDVNVIAVIGPADVVELEAHRTALDLPAEGRPRAVAAVPGQAGADRRSAVAQSKRTRPVVVAIAVEGYDDPAETRKVIASVKAESVIAIVDASRPLDETARWVEALENVDAIALDGALDGDRPAEVLSLDVPVIRVDGIAVDRIGWAALLCAQLTVLDLQRDSIHQ